VDQHEVYNEEFFLDFSPVTSYGSNTQSLLQLAKELQEWNTRRRLKEVLQLSAMGFYNCSQTVDRTGVVVEEVAARNVRLQQKRSLQQQQYGGMAA
jgi:hypothetical protein